MTTFKVSSDFEAVFAGAFNQTFQLSLSKPLILTAASTQREAEVLVANEEVLEVAGGHKSKIIY